MTPAASVAPGAPGATITPAASAHDAEIDDVFLDVGASLTPGIPPIPKRCDEDDGASLETLRKRRKTLIREPLPPLPPEAHVGAMSLIYLAMPTRMVMMTCLMSGHFIEYAG